MTDEKVKALIKDRVMQAIVQSLKDSALLVEGTAKEMCPVDNNLLRASITHEVDEENLEAWVYTPLRYAEYVEYPTRAHIIRPKNKKALAFEVGRKERLEQQNVTGRKLGKKMVVTKEVHHPGTTEQPFMRPSLDVNKDNINKIFANNIKKAFGQ